ncbi:MAG: hypothetical protein PHR56_08905 [Dehalococcoidales bacterium]|nr:hypothetical protein [Dehalococcoidales bacterium]
MRINSKGSQQGFAILETIVALAILGSAGVALLSGAASGMKATSIIQERTIAQSLVRSQLEFVENHAYLTYPSIYPINPGLIMPPGWELSSSNVSLVHATDDGLQRVNVVVRHNGEPIFSVETYKVNRN